MDNNFPTLYLAILIVLLGTVAWFVFRQLFKTRRIESALSRLQSKLSQEKGTAQEYFELGSILLSKNLATQAIAQFQKALKAAEVEAESNVSPIYNAIGYGHFIQEQYDLAIRNYKEALKGNPNYVTALNNLAHAYEKKNLTSQALEVYEQVLGQDPKNSTAKRRANSLRKRYVPQT
ncbi:MAG: tetratricopeptide repeat protein [Aphanocapsa sp. GSE-SYN-MK-11-07L]|jgi:tetratricopeptide (TPR) repeat protein|nr:tetratricopeptide repeat protein [Aphanocapsa sp. GSE-SYN-MK-11-07L]